VQEESPLEKASQDKDSRTREEKLSNSLKTFQGNFSFNL